MIATKDLSHRISIVVVMVILSVASRAEARRIGFANVARDGKAGQAAIEQSRDFVIRKAGGEQLSASDARAALEGPLDASSEADAAQVARAHQLLDSARAALKAFDYDEALDQLRQADGALRGILPSPAVDAELYEVNLLAGQVQAQKGDEARALDAFRLAHRLAPERGALDPARFRPQIVQLYDKAGRPADASTAGVINVVTEPPGATVWLDGRAVGVAPLELAGLAAGEHYLGASLDGHAPRSERIAVRAGAHAEQAFLLARLPAEQRARALRIGLLRPGLSLDDWRRGAAALADVASLDVLVLVRDAAGGGVEAAAWDVRSARLGSWVSLGDGGHALVESLPYADAGAIAVPAPSEVAGKVVLSETSFGAPGSKPPVRARPRWYRTWWGMSLIIGGGVLLTGAVLIATAPDAPSAPNRLVVTDPHWESFATAGLETGF